jgi:hypothetical protein
VAHVHIIDSGQEFNCKYGSVLSGVNCHTRWVPKEEPVCPDQTIPNLDDRFLGGDPEGVSSFVVEGC